jgi:hypothetical protein
VGTRILAERGRGEMLFLKQIALLMYRWSACFVVALWTPVLLLKVGEILQAWLNTQQRMVEYTDSLLMLWDGLLLLLDATLWSVLFLKGWGSAGGSRSATEIGRGKGILPSTQSCGGQDGRPSC